MVRIVVVSFEYGSRDGAAGLHAEARVQALLAEGFEVVLVTAAPPETVHDHRGGLSVVALPMKPPISRGGVARLLGRLEYARVRISLGARGRMFRWKWFFTWRRSISGMFGRGQFEGVLSLGGNAAGHLLGEKLGFDLGLPWFAELQDPLEFVDDGGDYNIDAVDRGLIRRVERAMVGAAGRFFLTAAAARDFDERWGVTGSLHSYPFQRFDPSSHSPGGRWLRPEPTPGVLTLIHAGTLSGTRNLDFLIDLAVLSGSRLEVWIAGAQLKNAASRERLPDLVSLVDLGRLDRAALRSACREADLPVVIQHRASISRRTIPSKVYELWSWGLRPLVLGFDNEELQKMSRQFGSPYVDMATGQAFGGNGDACEAGDVFVTATAISNPEVAAPPCDFTQLLKAQLMPHRTQGC